MFRLREVFSMCILKICRSHDLNLDNNLDGLELYWALEHVYVFSEDTHGDAHEDAHGDVVPEDDHLTQLERHRRHIASRCHHAQLSTREH